MCYVRLNIPPSVAHPIPLSFHHDKSNSFKSRALEEIELFTPQSPSLTYFDKEIRFKR